jgi:hypothetical protein
MDAGEKAFLTVMGLGYVTAIALAPWFGILPTLAVLLALAMCVAAAELLGRVARWRDRQRRR